MYMFSEQNAPFGPPDKNALTDWVRLGLKPNIIIARLLPKYIFKSDQPYLKYANEYKHNFIS